MLSRPAYLLLLLAVPLVFALARGRARLVAPLRALSLALVALALAELSWSRPPGGTEVTFVLDRSLSLPPAQERLGLEVVNAATRSLAAKDRARLIVFGGEAVVEGAVDEPVTTASSVVSRDQTDLEAALRLALASVQPGWRHRVVLVSDGVATRGDALRAVRPGSRIDVVPLEFAFPGDVAVEKLIVPESVNAHEPFKVRVALHAEAPRRVRLRLLRDGQEVDARELLLERGANVHVFDATLDRGGPAALTARVEPLEQTDENLPRNDAASAVVVAKGARRVLVVRRADDERSLVAAALRREGIETEEALPASLPRGPSSLEGYDAVLLDDVPADELSTEQMDALAFAVSETGMGLGMIGGEHSFGAGGWQGTSVEKVLPLDCAPLDAVARPSVALVLCLDRSGSMGAPTADGRTKLALATEGAVLAVRALAPKDLIGVVGFDDAPLWVAPLGPRAPGIERDLRALGPGGGTQLAPALDESVLALERADAAVKHLIVLTDGLSPGDFPPLVARARATRITISTIAVGADADKPLLQWMASAGSGKFYPVEREATLPRVFVQETVRVARALIDERRFAPALGPARELAPPGMPALRGLVRTSPRPRAEVALIGPDGTPLLATMTSGLGRTLAFTSDARARWAAEWVAWDGFAGFWARAVRAIARGVDDERLRVATRVEGGTARVSVEALDASGAFVDGLAIAGTVRHPSGESVPVTLRQTAPGLYESLVPAGEAGTYTVALRTGGRPLAAGFVVPFAAEYRRARSDRAHLEAIARAGGGSVVEPHLVLDGKRDFFRTDDLPFALDTRPVAGILLAVAVALFLVDVTIRKLAIDTDQLRAWLRPAEEEAPPPRTDEPRRTDVTSRLLDAKKRARER